LTRGLVHRAVRDEKAPRVVKRTGRPPEPAVCERCGAVYRGKTWRAGERSKRTPLMGVAWTVCPACRQVAAGEYFGRVLVRGAFADAHEAEIRARVAKVAARARYTQPERRIVSMDRTDEGLEVLTTSQKLAHRVARSLEKAFGGEADYHWTEPHGELFAVWQREDAAPAGERVPPHRRSRRQGRRAPVDLEIQTRRIALDPRWRDVIEEEAARLAERFPELIRLHATLSHAAHHRHGAEEVSIVANVPRRALRAAKRGPLMLEALHAAFDGLARELDRYHGTRRSVSKGANPRLMGSIKRIFRDGGYGFIRLPEGREVYFHRNSVRALPWSALVPGIAVELDVEEGEEGPQASQVVPVRTRRQA
jgi:cold shock CspA family protein